MSVKQDDRREHARYSVFAGNAEITSILGPKGSRKASGRARIINWSRGGVLLKVPSPRRRMLFFKQEPVVGAADMIKCILRLPPQYSDIDVSAEVVRVERCTDDPDQLQVGVNFISIPADRLEAMARLLEPRPKPSVRAPRASSTSGRQKTSGRTARKSQRLPGPDAEPRKSQRVEAKSERTKSARKEPTPSQRLTMRQTETLEVRHSGRQSRVSGRL